MNIIKITPVKNIGSHGRTGTLQSEITSEEISTILGFEPNVNSDEDKVENEWRFRVDCEVPSVHKGKLKRATFSFGIWDYKGARWSTYGDKQVLNCLFNNRCS